MLAGACQQCSHTTDTAGPSHRRDTPRGSESGLYSSLDGWPPSIAQLDILLIVQTIVTLCWLPMTLSRETVILQPFHFMNVRRNNHAQVGSIRTGCNAS